MSNQKRAVLCTDLTRYHEHLVLGITGTVVGSPLQRSRYGSSYLTVKFDCCGHTRNIIRDNLWVGVFPPPSKVAELIPDQYAPTPTKPPSGDPRAQIEEKRRLIALWDEISLREVMGDTPVRDDTRETFLRIRDQHKSDLQGLLLIAERKEEAP